ncbi:MAG TPA: dihydroxyacetone kinase subunit L, partial [Actinobacteria bacterium]|nr:dihydroxyacetone kinase subunit L [Actinomycetota bacterium]
MGRVGAGTIPGGLITVDSTFLRNWIEEIRAAITAERDHLTQLDAAIGDADHGVNMERGFSAVAAKLASAEGLTPGRVLMSAGATLISTVGGASGPLYGTALREAGKALGDGEEFDAAGLLVALRAALAGVQKLGAATPGDKTMVDA